MSHLLKNDNICVGVVRKKYRTSDDKCHPFDIIAIIVHSKKLVRIVVDQGKRESAEINGERERYPNVFGRQKRAAFGGFFEPDDREPRSFFSRC